MRATQEVLRENVFLNESTFYVVVLANSDLHIDMVNLTGPNGNITIVNRDFSFKTTGEGMYAFSVTGHYAFPPLGLSDLPSPLPPNSPYLQRATRISGGLRVELDTTVDVAIFELVRKIENVYPYSFLLSTGASSLVAGVILTVLSRMRLSLLQLNTHHILTQ